MNENQPSQTVTNGRAADGKFTRGNRAALGNGVARAASQFRLRLFSAITTRDFADVAAVLLKKAKAGEPWAVKLALEYLLGPPTAADILQRIETLEAVLNDRKE